MAVLICEFCGNQQGLQASRPIIYGPFGNIIREGYMKFDASSGQCIVDHSDHSGQGRPYARRCFNCQLVRMFPWADAPNFNLAAASFDYNQNHEQFQNMEPEPLASWSIRSRSCGCRGSRCQGGMCGCSSNGFMCSVFCGCGGHIHGSCMNELAPAGPASSSKKCACRTGCHVRDRVAGSCGCGSAGIGCGEDCECTRQGGQCYNPYNES